MNSNTVQRCTRFTQHIQTILSDTSRRPSCTIRFMSQKASFYKKVMNTNFMQWKKKKKAACKYSSEVFSSSNKTNLSESLPSLLLHVTFGWHLKTHQMCNFWLDQKLHSRLEMTDGDDRSRFREWRLRDFACLQMFVGSDRSFSPYWWQLIWLVAEWRWQKKKNAIMQTCQSRLSVKEEGDESWKGCELCKSILQQRSPHHCNSWHAVWFWRNPPRSQNLPYFCKD